MASRVPAFSPRRHSSLLRRKAPHRAPVPGRSPTWPTEDDWGVPDGAVGTSGSRSEHERAAGANAVRPRSRGGSRLIGWGAAEGPAAPSVRSDAEAVTPKPQRRVARCPARDGSPLNRGQCIAHRPWLRPPGLFRQASTRASNTRATSAGSAGTRNARPSCPRQCSDVTPSDGIAPARSEALSSAKAPVSRVASAPLAAPPDATADRRADGPRGRPPAARWPESGRSGRPPAAWRPDGGRLDPLPSRRRSDEGRKAVRTV